MRSGKKRIVIKSLPISIGNPSQLNFVGTYPPVLACFFIRINSAMYDAGDHLLGGCHIYDGQRSVVAA